MVVQLRQQLVEKESTLTDCRLEALTSAHQLDHMKEQLMKLRAENAALKQTNEQLAKIALRSDGSQTSLPQLCETENEMHGDGFMSERAYGSARYSYGWFPNRKFFGYFFIFIFIFIFFII